MPKWPLQWRWSLIKLSHGCSSSGTFVPSSDTGPCLSSVRDYLVVIISGNLATEGQRVLVDVLLEGMVQPLGLLIIMRVIHLVIFVLYRWTEQGVQVIGSKEAGEFALPSAPGGDFSVEGLEVLVALESFPEIS